MAKVSGLQKLDLLAKTSELLVKKYTPKEISEALQVTLPLARGLVKDVQKEWAKANLDTIESSRSKVLAEERHLRREAWGLVEQHREKAAPYLQVVGQSLERERKLLGLDVPQKITMGELESALVEMIQDLRRTYSPTVNGELLKLLPGEEYESALQEEEALLGSLSQEVPPESSEDIPLSTEVPEE